MIEEVKALLPYSHSMNPSAGKALGFRELSSYLRNEITLEEAISLSQASTRKYAKRQCTWFNNQLKATE